MFLSPVLFGLWIMDMLHRIEMHFLKLLLFVVQILIKPIYNNNNNMYVYSLLFGLVNRVYCRIIWLHIFRYLKYFVLNFDHLFN